MVKEYTDWSDCLSQCHPWPQRWTSDSNQQDATMDAETVKASAGIQTIEMENDGVSRKGFFDHVQKYQKCAISWENEVSKYSDLSKTEDEKFKNEPSSVHTWVCSTHSSEELHTCPCFDTMLRVVKSFLLFGDCRCCKAHVAFELWHQIETLELLRSPRLVCQIPAFKCALLLEMIGLSDTSRALVC